MGIKLQNKANGQAEASNQILIKLIKKKIKEKPRKWYLTLNEALWAYRMDCHGSIKSSPYELVYGHNVVLPWEIQTRSRRVTLQNDLIAEVYKNLMMDDLEDLSCQRLRALENFEANKLWVARHYKKVKNKQFCEGELVWKVRLSIKSKDNRFGKWSPNWEGPYQIKHCALGNAYILETLEGEEEFDRAINGKYLKKYYPSVWINT